MSRRSRTRGSGRSRLSVAIAAGFVCVLVVWSGGLASTAFSTGTLPRAAAADVTVDEAGAHALDTAGTVHINATDPLVNVTNHHARDVTVTVSLRADSTHLGDLSVDGVDEGDVATFTLRETNTQTVELAVPDDSSVVGETVYFHVNATATGFSVSATDRTAQVDG